MARFDGDTSVIGRTVRLGNDAYTIVGVMPAGFGLPISHSLWVPLALNAPVYARRDGRADQDLRQARARRRDQHGAGRADVDGVAERGGVSRHGSSHPSDRQAVRRVALVRASKIRRSRRSCSIPPTCCSSACSCSAARTSRRWCSRARSSRDAEISIRTALGASRARIAGQLFAEALVSVVDRQAMRTDLRERTRCNG